MRMKVKESVPLYLHYVPTLRYIKDRVQSINVTRTMRGNNYIVYGESQWQCEVAGELTSTCRASLWVICVASHCVSCSQHLVVVVSENAGTALVWNSNGRCRRLGYGGSSLDSVCFTAT